MTSDFSTIRRLAVAVLIIFSLIVISFPASAQQPSSLSIVSIDHSEFPQVTIQFRATNADNQVMEGLTADDLVLSEQDNRIQDFSLELIDGGPVRVIYLVDLGRFANFNTLGLSKTRQAFTQFVDGDFFVDGEDTVEILARANDGQTDETISLLETTNSAEEFTSFVRSLEFDGTAGNTRALTGIEGILDQISDPGNDAGAPTFIVLLTHIVEQPAGDVALERAQALGNRAEQLGVPIFVMQSRLGDEDDQPLRTLAANSGGSYLALNRNEDQTSAFNDIYATINSQRQSYQVQFRSSLGISESRTVTLELAAQENEAGPAAIAYQVEVQPAQVELVEPSAGAEIQLQAGEDGQKGGGVVSVRGQIAGWPDGHPRQISRASLMVDGESVATAETVSGEEFNIDWSAEMPEESVERQIQLQIIDELGVEATSDAITVSLIPPEAEGGFFSSCLADPLQIGCLAAILIPLLLIIVVVVVLIGLGVIVVSSREKEPKPKEDAQPAKDLDKTLVPGAEWDSSAADGELLAQLEVIDGPNDMVGMRLPIEEYVTKLGRDPERADITFYSEGNTSVSGLHCELQLYFGTFYLTDKNSTNGTRVNGQKLAPEKAIELSDGDEIVLGDPTLRGVELKFHRADEIDRKRGLDETQIEVDLEEVGPEGGATEIWVDEDDEDTDSWMEELE